MISITVYNNKLIKEWDSFIKESKNGTFMLYRDYMDYHSDRFIDGSLLFYEDEEIIALLPLSIHEKTLRSHGGLTYGGFITSEKMKQSKMLQCFETLMVYMARNSFSKIYYKAIPQIYHRLPAQEDLYALIYNGAALVRRDVSTTVDLSNLLKMPKGRKAQISKAKRENIIVNESTDFESFIELENQVLRDKHNTKAVHTAAELHLLKSKFPHNIVLFEAKKDTTLVAAVLLYVYDNLVHTQYMASNAVGREFGGLDLIISHIIHKYKDSKKFLDFGISTENNGLYLNEGLIAQKESFGGRSICYDFYELDVRYD